MRFLLLTFGLLLTPLFPAAAQVSVEVVLDEMEYLRDESLFVKVRIANRSGQPLKLGQTADWLTFNVQSQDAYTVEKSGDAPVTGEFTVESSQTATKTVNLMPHFAFPQPGRYMVSATVKIPQWSEDFVSTPKTFHITRGVRVWEEEFGVPRKEGAPEVRQYSLVRATGLKQTRLYARITDPDDNRVFRVVPLGPVVSFGRPEAQVDRLSRLHMLFQNGPRSFFYGAISPEGDWLVREAYDYTESRPTLRMNDAGKVIVAGGVRRFTEADLPPAGARGATNNAAVPLPKALPPVTNTPASSPHGNPTPP